MRFEIQIKDINALSDVEITAIYMRLSWPNSGSASSIQKELDKRYIRIKYDTHPASDGVEKINSDHPPMALAFVWLDGTLVGWVGTRHWPEKFKGRPVTAQTVECFVDPAYRRRGLAKMGLLALISAGQLNREEIVSVYDPSVVALAQSCGCQTVIYCESV